MKRTRATRRRGQRPGWSPGYWNSWYGYYGSYGHWGSSWRSAEANGHGQNWTKTKLVEILPDFVQGWFLFNDAGLTPGERNMIYTAVQGDYRVDRIAQELRNQWDEASLRKREGAGRTQNSYLGNYEDEDYAEDEAEHGFNVEELSPEGQALYSEAEESAQSALAILERALRTLKEARSKQHQVRMSRQYFKTSGRSSTWRPSSTTGSSGRPSSSVPDDSKMTCLKCGKMGHRAANCPSKGQQAQVANEEEDGECAPFVCYNEIHLATEVTPDKIEHGEILVASPLMSTSQTMRQGYGVLDGGATRTLGSVKAIQTVLDINQAKHGTTKLLGVNTEQRPVFSFGNSSEGRCASTISLGISAGQKDGNLTIHALDEGEGPVLLSVATLRSLGAVIDFALDARQIIPLRRSKTGHQLVPLTSNLFEGSRAATRAVPGLADFLP